MFYFPKKFFFLSFVFTLPLIGNIDNSIIPQIEKFESIENLPTRKFSANQFLEIQAALLHKNESIRLVTYNLLFDLYDKNLPEVYRWPTRKFRVLDSIQHMHPDILGVQELYPNQLKDLLIELDSQYTFIGKPCLDGEMNGIFFKKERFHLLEKKIFYMTNTPEIPSKESLTIVILQDLITNKKFAVLNAHLALSNINKREFQICFIANVVSSIKNDYPVLFTGDLNTFPNRLDLEKLPAYDGDYLHRILAQVGLKDAKEISLLGHLGPLSTFTNKEPNVTPFEGEGTPGVFLDHIYVSDGVTILIHAIEPSKVNGHFPSDHMPVLIDYLIP